MATEDFLQVPDLTSSRQKPESDDWGQPIKVQLMYEMIYKRGFSGYHHRNAFRDQSMRVGKIKRKRINNTNSHALSVLHPLGVPISLKMYKNSQDLLKCVPPIDHTSFIRGSNMREMNLCKKFIQIQRTVNQQH